LVHFQFKDDSRSVLTFTGFLITLFQKQNLFMQGKETGFQNRLQHSQAPTQLEGYLVTRLYWEVMRTANSVTWNLQTKTAKEFSTKKYL